MGIYKLYDLAAVIRSAMPAHAQIGYRIWHRQETRGL